MKIKALIAFVMFTGVLFGQTTTYTGTVKDLSGSVVTSGNVTFTLTPSVDTTISGTSRFTPNTVNCTINGSGALVANDGVSACVVTQNTALTPTGTSYTICIQPYFTSPGSCFVDYAVTSSKDISTVAPTPQLSPNYPVTGVFFGTANVWTAAQTGTFLGVRDCKLDGVVANGVTDDGAHVNTCITNAISAGNGGVRLPGGRIHIVTPINAANLRGMTIQGAGSDFYGYSSVSTLTELMCDTATVCLDTVGSRSMIFKDFALRIANTYATPSTTAVFEGRTASNSGTCFSENNYWDRVNIWTDHNGSVNGTKGYIGFYNIGGEARVYNHPYVEADLPFVFATTNVYSLTSPYETIQTTCGQSMTQVNIMGGTITPQMGTGISAYTTADFTLTSVFLMGSTNNIGQPFSAIALNGSYATNWNGNIHVESLQNNNSVFTLAATTIDKNKFNVNVGGSVASAFCYIGFDAAGHTVGANTFAFDTHNEAGNQRCFISNASAETINGGEFYLSGTVSPLNASNVTLNGTVVRASGFTDGNVTFNAGSQYTLYSDSGVSFRQTVRAVGALQLGATDTGLSRGAAGQVNCGNGAAGDATCKFVMGSTQIGTGTTVSKLARYTATLSPASVAANTTAVQTFTFTGVATGDTCVGVSKPAAQAGLGIVGCYNGGTNTIGIVFSNNTASPITPTASELYAVVVLQ